MRITLQDRELILEAHNSGSASNRVTLFVDGEAVELTVKQAREFMQELIDAVNEADR